MSEVREMTVKEMLGLLEWHEQMGRGDYVVKADPRGLCFFDRSITLTSARPVLA